VGGNRDTGFTGAVDRLRRGDHVGLTTILKAEPTTLHRTDAPAPGRGE